MRVNEARPYGSFYLEKCNHTLTKAEPGLKTRGWVTLICLYPKTAQLSNAAKLMGLIQA